jgi:hypothetical protein
LNASILFVITGDPRITRRTAEAIRIAAGIDAGRRSVVSVYLRGAAVLALSEFPDEFLDDENYTRYLPILSESGRPIYVEKGSPHLAEIGEAAVKFQEVTDQELAVLAAGNNYVARF